MTGAGTASRLLRAAAAPLAPAAQLRRIVPAAVAAGRSRELLRASIPLLAFLAAWAAGEAVGSLLGEGDSRSRWT